MGSHQIGRIVFAVQALLLTGLAVAGLLTAAAAPTGSGHVAGFLLNTPHSVLLLATAGASVLAAWWSRFGRIWAMVQAALYTLAFVIGTAASAGRPQDTWLALNTPDHFLHLGLALVAGVLTTSLFWPAAPADGAPSRIMPGQPPPTEQRQLRTQGDESEETQDMIAAEVAVTEGHATPQQARRVQEDRQRRADAQRRHAWQQSDEFKPKK